MYRLLAIDLDGTLLSPEKLITPRTYNLLCQIEQKSVAIVIATGQTAQVLRAVCGKLPLTALQIIENGAVVVNIQNGAVLHEKLIRMQLILPTMKVLRQFCMHRAYHPHKWVYVD